MSLLKEHFERVAVAEANGFTVIPGIYYDIGGTLLPLDKIDEALVDFAIWNMNTRLIGDNHIFTSDMRSGPDMIREENSISQR